MSNQIFVFGSNLAGAHGGGSAAAAHKHHGAVWGEGVGRHGDSYAIPTLDEKLQELKICDIEAHVRDFMEYARRHPELEFKIVAIGCGIAGFSPDEMAPMFIGHPNNCFLPKEFSQIIEKALS